MKLSAARIVVTGSQTPLGREILAVLSDGGVPKNQVTALESGRVGTGETVSFGDEHTLDVKSSDEFDFKGTHAVLHAGQAREAVALARKATGADALFVDCSGTYAMDPDVPLIVPEVNGAALEKNPPKKIVANPNSLSVFLSLALYPLHVKASITRVVISTYQAVSHWGREAQDELFSQTKALFMAQGTPPHQHLPKQIAFNVYPMVGPEREDGFTELEWNTISQVKKIIDPKIKLAVNTVTIPAFVGDGMMVNVEAQEEISPIKAAMWMTGQKGLGVLEDTNDLPTHAEIAGEDFAYVTRLRGDFSVENGLAFWLIGDNLRQGSAANAVKIAEAYLKTR